MSLEPTDLRVDVYTCGGGINPAVRITHLPTGLVASSNDTPSQMRNRIIAENRLQERLGLPRGDPDATRRGAEELLQAWYQWWSTHTDTDTGPPPDRLHVHTAAYLAARAIEDTRPTGGL